MTSYMCFTLHICSIGMLQILSVVTMEHLFERERAVAPFKALFPNLMEGHKTTRNYRGADNF